jgi:hypothetical protein
MPLFFYQLIMCRLFVQAPGAGSSVMNLNNLKIKPSFSNLAQTETDDGVKNAKNIAAVVYLLVLVFLIGGSYINQHRNNSAVDSAASTVKP